MFDLLYKAYLKLRHYGYDKGWLSSLEAPLCVVSVGNVALGGVGKTPVVQKLARELSSTYPLAILLRGYRGRAEHSKVPVLVTRDTRVDICGDEALVHVYLSHGIQVYASKHRILSAQKAAERGIQVVLLDDGMQHRKLKRDVEIAVIDGQEDIASQRLVPYGSLRDLPERLRTVDAVVMHNAEEDWQSYSKGLRQFTEAPIIATRMVPKSDSLSILKGKKIACFSALGRPKRFEAMLSSIPVDIVSALRLRDHALFDCAFLERFSKKAKEAGAELLVCTPKDFVKLPNDLGFLSLPVHVIDAEVTIIGGQKEWDCLVENTKDVIKQRIQKS